MPLIKGPDDLELISTTFRMPKNLRDEIKEYCKWGGFKDGYFYVAAIKYVLANDKEWQKEVKRNNKNKKKITRKK